MEKFANALFNEVNNPSVILSPNNHSHPLTLHPSALVVVVVLNLRPCSNTLRVNEALDGILCLVGEQVELLVRRLMMVISVSK